MNFHKSLAAYDTVAQLETVINNLKAAVARGDKEFVFPTIEELTKPLASEKQIAPVKDKKVEFYLPDEYDADATLERLCSLPVIGEDGLTPEDRAFRDDLIKTYDEYQAKKKTPSDISDSLARGEETFTFSKIDEPKTSDKETISDSLERAGIIALENHRRYNRLHMQKEANYERELYLICKKAYRELKKTA